MLRVQTCLSQPVLTVADLLSCFDGELHWVHLWQAVEVLPLQPQKNAENDHFHTLVGIAWLLYLLARQCTSTHRLRDSWVFAHKTLYFMPSCCLVLNRITFSISEPDKVHHWNRVATDSTSWDKQACTHDTLWRQRYVTTSKEYLTNSHILPKYFELVFLQLQLVKTFELSWNFGGKLE